jgi:GNAT superfamily N-acetyltransferase
MGETNYQPSLFTDRDLRSPLAALSKLKHLEGRSGGAEDRAIVLTRPLNEAEWEMIRAFLRRTNREDLRLRFGQPLDFQDDATLRRFFDIEDGVGELVCMLDEHGAIAGILHRILVSSAEVEIALVVRSDLKRVGIGESLLRIALSRATKQQLKTLSALVLRENGAMLRLARKIGFAPRKLSALTVELECELGRRNEERRSRAAPSMNSSAGPS